MAFFGPRGIGVRRDISRMMITEGAGELNPAARAAAAVLSRPAIVAARTLVPIILTVTEQEAVGARMHVGGLRVIDRAIRQLARLRDTQRDTVGIVDRLLNHKISSHVTQRLLIHLRVTPALVTLVAGFVGLYGALMVAAGTSQSVVMGFAILEGYAVLDGCAGELGRVRLHQTALGAWLDTVVGDFVNVVMILAVGLALWHHGGTYLDMKTAAAAAAMTLFYAVVSYRELMRQGEGDVMRLRWWFAYGQSLKNVSGAGSSSIKAVMLLGRRDVVIVLGLALAYFEQLWVALIYMMIVAMVRAAGALGQLFTPDWRIRPQA